MAGSAQGVRKLEHRAPALPALGAVRRFPANLRRDRGGPRPEGRHGGRDICQGTPARRWRKKSGCPPDESADRQAIGRSRGGLTTKLMAMVDKTGRLVRFTIRPGNAAEALSCPFSSTASPQANSSLTKPTIPTPSGSRSPRMELSQPFPAGQPPGPVLVRPDPVPDPPPCRELLLRHQAVSSRRHQVQQAGGQLLRHG